MGTVDCGFKVHVSSIAHENKLILLEKFVLKTYPYLCSLKTLFIFVLDMYAKKQRMYFSEESVPYITLAQKTMDCFLSQCFKT